MRGFNFSEMAPLGHLIIPFRNLPKILKDRYTKEDNQGNRTKNVSSGYLPLVQNFE